MMTPTHDAESRLQYCVDEAGDPPLFNRKGRVIVGAEGCSRSFILGKLATYIQQQNARDSSDRYRENEQYDLLVKELLGFADRGPQTTRHGAVFGIDRQTFRIDLRQDRDAES